MSTTITSEQAALPTQAEAADAEATWLEQLQDEVESHPGVNHLLLARLATGPYTRSDYRQFGLQHFALVGFFTTYMEQLLLRAPSSTEKLWLAKILVAEYGEGSDGRDHTTLYGEYLRSVGAAPGEEKSTPLSPEVWAFVGEHLRICREEPFLVGMGALGPGHEWAIPKMFHHIIPGLRRAGLDSSEMLYFDLHTEQDLDHAAWMTEVLQEMVSTDAQREEVIRGARLSLSARYHFWNGVERAIVAKRQPVSTEVVAQGLHAVAGKREEARSPGNLNDLKAAVERFKTGAPWPVPTLSNSPKGRNAARNPSPQQS